MIRIASSGSLHVTEHQDFAALVVASLFSLFSAVAVTIIRTSLIAACAVSALAGVGVAPALAVAAPTTLPFFDSTVPVLGPAGVKRLHNESLSPWEQAEAHKRQQIALTWGRSATGGRSGLPVLPEQPEYLPRPPSTPEEQQPGQDGPRTALRMVTRPTTAMETNNGPHCSSGANGYDIQGLSVEGPSALQGLIRPGKDLTDSMDARHDAIMRRVQQLLSP
ncbi:hypothetical protein DL771_003131 [Monosporascus sp. 5C6A]|nr:hypothetical protein DL771_003131 [Monosporascus sp. 5C6A]